MKKKESPQLHDLVRDTLRFTYSFSHILTRAPLQLYNAGLVFSPLDSIFRRSFTSLAYKELDVRTQLRGQWNECLHTLEGHSRFVHSVVFSPDGSRVASGSGDHTVRVWDLQTGQCLHTLEGHFSPVHNMAFSPDGSRVVSGSMDRTIRVWDVQTGQCQYTLEGHSDSIMIVVFSPDGSRVASGSSDSRVRVWDVLTGEFQYTLEGHSDSVRSVIFSPDGSRVASGSDDKTVRVWDMQSGDCQYTLKGNSSLVWRVAFSPDGLRVASGSWDHKVRVWDIASETQLLCYDTYTLEDLEFNNDGSNILTADQIIPIPSRLPLSSNTTRSSSSDPTSGGKLEVNGE